MSNHENKKIVLNTAIIYVRLAVVTVVGLLSSRYVLQALGVSDYGLYNVVGCVITMINVVSIAMHTTTRRYLNIEMGKKDGNLNRIFNVSMLIHLVFAFSFFLIIQFFGSFYIDNYMNIPVGKEEDAHFVLLISNLVAAVGILSVPFQGLLNAYEDFLSIALQDIICAFLKLFACVFLLYYSGNALRMYAIIVSLITLFSFIYYSHISYKKHKEIIRPKLYKDKQLYKEILIYNNYTALGASAFLGRTQGATMLINFFFGTAVNAAFAVAYSIQNYVQQFVNNLGVASSPKITQKYAAGDCAGAVKLCEQINRFTILIMSIVFFTLYIRLDYIMGIWLKIVPDGAILYSRWTLIFALVSSFSAGNPTLIQAVGKIKWFQIIGSIVELALLPVCYVLFVFSFPPETLFIVLCILTLSYRLVSIWLMKIFINIDVKTFVTNAYLQPIAVIIVLYLVLVISSSVVCNIHSLIVICVTGVVSLFVCYMIGLKKSEKDLVINIVISKLRNKV